jgi:hypothetical protein
MIAEASPWMLNLTYPLGNANSTFILLVSPFKLKKDISGWDDIQGLSVEISGNVDGNFSLGWAGSYGGAYAVIK